MTGKSILFVEDDRDIRTLLADFLVREGFAVEVAEDGVGVDRALARMKPDLVILDLMLPGSRPFDLPSSAHAQRGAGYHADRQERRH